MYSTIGYTFGTVYQKFLFTGNNKKIRLFILSLQFSFDKININNYDSLQSLFDHNKNLKYSYNVLSPGKTGEK